MKKTYNTPETTVHAIEGNTIICASQYISGPSGDAQNGTGGYEAF